GCGTIFDFQAKTNRHAVDTRHRFTGPPDGAHPHGDVAYFGLSGNSAFGTTTDGGTGSCPDGCGTIYRVDLGKNYVGTIVGYTKVYDFPDAAAGAHPYGTLVVM